MLIEGMVVAGKWKTSVLLALDWNQGE
jgi:hypothetical protein